MNFTQRNFGCFYSDTAGAKVPEDNAARYRTLVWHRAQRGTMALSVVTGVWLSTPWVSITKGTKWGPFGDDRRVLLLHSVAAPTATTDAGATVRSSRKGCAIDKSITLYLFLRMKQSSARRLSSAWNACPSNDGSRSYSRQMPARALREEVVSARANSIFHALR